MADIDSGLPVRSVQDVDERVQVKVVDATTPSQQMEVDTDNDAHVKAKLRDDSGAAFGTETNPVFTTVTDNPQDEVHDFDTSTAIAKNASGTHTFAPATGTKVSEIVVSASGYAKFEVSFGVTASEVLTYVLFNSTAKPFEVLPLPKPITLAGGTDTMLIVKTNLDNQAQDLYSTINGQEF